MGIRKLLEFEYRNGASGGVTIPKDQLREEGLIDEDGGVRDAVLNVERVDDGEWRLRRIDD